MKSASRFVAFLCCLFYTIGQAQEVIPFKMNGHYNILVEGIINQKDTVDLMFQLAMQEASLAPNRTHPVKSVVFDTTEFPEGLSKGNRIQVGETVVEPIWIWDNEYTGNGAEGKIGTQLFGDHIVKINYDMSQFELYDTLPATTDFIRLPLEQKNGQLFVEVVSTVEAKEIQIKVLLQSGFSGALLFNNYLADEYHLADVLPRLEEKTMLNAAGQKLTSLVCEIPAITVGGIRFEKAPVQMFTGEIKNQTTSYIGADLIHRFNWIIDKKGGYAYIQKNKYFEDPYYFARKN